MNTANIIEDLFSAFAGDQPEARFKDFVRQHKILENYQATVSSYWPWRQHLTTQVDRILNGPKANVFLEALVKEYPLKASFSLALDNLSSFHALASDQSRNYGINHSSARGGPFLGMSAFEIWHSHLFFGRDTEINRLAVQVEKHPLSALAGASGSGKSSLLKAGLCNTLGLEADWRCLPFRLAGEVNSCPFSAIARQLIRLTGSFDGNMIEETKAVKTAAAKLRTGELTLADLLATVSAATGEQQALLIFDQFEELFSASVDGEVRRQFLDQLRETFADVPKRQVHLLLSFRADFLNHLLVDFGWSQALQDKLFLLGPMSEDGLREAIEKPAKLHGVEFEKNLIDTLISGVNGRDAGLPMLQFCLQEMWQVRERRLREAANSDQTGRVDIQLTWEDYRSVGEIEGALIERAERAYEELREHQEYQYTDDDFRRLFARLVNFGNGQKDTRRISNKDELGPRLSGLAEALADEKYRLLFTHGSTAGLKDEAATQVEVVHEALIDNWPRLKRWIERDREFRVWLDGLRLRIEEFERDEAQVLSGSSLAVARDNLADRRDDLSEREQTFISASVSAEDERTLKARLRRRQTLIAVSVAALVFAGLFGLSLNSLATAERERIEAQALHALEDVERGNSWEALERLVNIQNNSSIASWIVDAESVHLANIAIIRAVETAPVTILPQMTEDIFVSEFSRDGSMVALIYDDGSARLWDTMTGKLIHRIGSREEEFTHVKFGPDGKTAVLALDAGPALVWDIEANAESFRFGSDRVDDFNVLSPDGTFVLTATFGGAVKVLVAASSESVMTLIDSTGGFAGADFSPDGKMVAVVDSEGQIWVGDILNRKVHSRLVEPDDIDSDIVVSGIEFSNDGSEIFVTTDVGIRRFRAHDGHDRGLIRYSVGKPSTAALDPLGDFVLSGKDSGRVEVALVNSKRPQFSSVPVATFKGSNAETTSLAVSQSGQHFVSGSSDGSAAIWDLNRLRSRRVPVEGASWISMISKEAGGGLVVPVDFDRVRVLSPDLGGKICEFGNLDGLQTAETRVSSDGRVAATPADSRDLYVWNTSDCEIVKKIGLVGKLSNSEWRDFFTQDDYIEIRNDGSVLLRNPENGGEIVGIGGKKGEVYRTDADFLSDFSISPDQRLLAGSSLGKSRVWEIGREEPILSFSHPNSWVQTLAFSPDAKFLAASLHSDLSASSIIVWDLETREQIALLRGHSSWVNELAFGKDGSTLFSASHDQSVRIWDIETQREISRVMSHNTTVTAISLVGSGDMIATGDNDGHLKVRKIPDPAEAWTEARRRVALRDAQKRPDVQ